MLFRSEPGQMFAQVLVDRIKGVRPVSILQFLHLGASMMAAPYLADSTLAEQHREDLKHLMALFNSSLWFAASSPEPIIGDLDCPELAGYIGHYVGAPRSTTRTARLSLAADSRAPSQIESKELWPEPPGGNQVVPGVSIIQRPDKAEPQPLRLCISPRDLAHPCYKYRTDMAKLPFAPPFPIYPLKLQESSPQAGGNTFVIDETNAGGFKSLRAYDGFILKVGECLGGTARKHRILHHVHPTKNVQTARAFGSLKASSDSEEIYGATCSLLLTTRHSHLIPGAPPSAQLSDSGSSGTSAGDSQCSVLGRPVVKIAYESFITPQSNEESKPEWDGSELRVTNINDGAVEELPVLLHANPRRGSTSGGEEIYLVVKNLPSTTVLYARFGCNIAPTVSSLIGSEPENRNERTDNLPPVSHCGWCTCLPSPSGNSSRSRRRYVMSSAFRS